MNTKKNPHEKDPCRRGEARAPLALALALLGAAAILASLVLGMLGAHYRAWAGAPVLGPEASVTVVIPHDTAWPGVVARMAEQGVIRRPRYFDFWARRRGLPAEVKAGTYELEGPMRLERLDELLRQGGSVEQVTLTIPEGFTIFHIADRLEALGLANRRDFLRAARSEELLRRFDLPGESFEGYLFPDTYRIRQGATPEQILVTLHEQWLREWGELVEAHPGALDAMASEHGLRRHDVIILASIIERETNHAPELPLIARVFLNRLDRDMRLQTDPTCVYGEETYREIPHPRYCRDELNRYSTYVIEGLPPGPISNPGRASLAAALQPAQGEQARRYIFFVARRDGTGAHHFTATYKEHKAAIERYLK